ncbi:eCIS core domain-containing protein [Actinomadura macra]|uniref:eCIS core domain-containing protein n=1 Tax=Actinomadura macra TaxID=46164 RepID=UPI0008315CDA|nr:DUF4157 domain-containing protein [Actinomadura macra]
MRAQEERRDGQGTTATGRKRSSEGARVAQAAHAFASGQAAVLPPTSVMALQRMVGNTALGRLLGQDEQEQNSPPPGGPSEVQRSPVHDVLRSPGRPLDQGVRADMEAALGTDFSDVRVHTDRAAHESAVSVSAQAYTSGSHIVFQQGGYDASSSSGRRLLAHELTHVVQQRSGPVAGTDTGDGLAVSDPSDRFEREAEQVAAQVVDGAGQVAVARSVSAATQAQAQGSAEAIPVARLMSLETFKQRTKKKRGHKIVPVEQALADYHALPQQDFVARRAQLERLRTAASDYLRTSKTKKHEGVVNEVVGESHGESNSMRLDAVIQGVRERATGHQQIYTLIIAVNQVADRVGRLRRLMQAQDAIVAEQAHTDADIDSDLGFLVGEVANWLSIVAGPLTPDEARALVGDDLARLTRLSTDPAVPEITRTILSELLANQGLVNFTQGTPGTTLSRPGDPGKYTLKHKMDQPGATTERLGSLAHELTHVDAGESYDNTAILLLFKQGLTDEEIGRLAVQRRAVNDRLRVLLNAHQGLAASQEQLFEYKLDYMVEENRLGHYATNYRNSRKIDQATYDRIMALNTLTGRNNGLLVEYDTVLNQLLVYLHQWGVDPETPLYAETLGFAEDARRERRS